MVYFRCTSSGSGKGNTVIVTCAEQFAGVAITIAKIGKSYTKVCPLSAPYVVKFYGVEAGTYTVSATVSGQTYSAEVVVQDVSCVLNYGFTWKTWVDTAQYLDSTDYASLSEVLADEEAVRELFLEHACVDYMADSTSSNADLETIIENDLCAKWINNSDYALDFLGANTVIKALMDTADKYGYGEWVITDDSTTPPTWGAKGNVPVMTANTAPYGTASASNEQSGAAYKAFDGDVSASSPWMPNVSANAWIQYKFTNPVCATKVHINPVGGSASDCRVKNFKIQGSNDGTSFTDIYTSVFDSAKYSEGDYFTFNNTSYYLYYRLQVVDIYPTGNYYIGVKGLQFYGRELKVSVPTMTSNTAPYGECVQAPTEYGNAYNAFDNSDSTISAPSVNNAEWYVGYKFTDLVALRKVAIKTRSGYNSGNKNYLQYSDDGITWQTDENVDLTTMSTASTLYVFDVELSPHKAFRVHLSSEDATVGNDGFSEIQFYGLDYSEKEFEAGTTKKWLYDHGVELETMTLTNTNANATGEKRSNEVLIAKTGTSNASQVVTPLDLTPYNLLRCVLGDEMSTNVSDGTCGRLCVLSSALIDISNMSNIVAATVIHVPSDKNIPNNISVDIASCDNTYYVGLVVHGESNYTIRNTLKELWLE